MHATDQPAGVKPTIVLVHGAFAIAAFATEEGENLNDVESGSQDSILGAALVQYKYPAGPDGETAVELAVDPALFREAWAADLPAETAALMAATQRPTAVTAFSEPSGPPAWKKNTGVISASSSGGSPRPGGPSTTLRSRAARPPSITRITWRS